MMNLKQKIAKASELGTAAHKAGMQRAPILNRGIHDLIHGMQVGEGAADIMTAYTKAYDAAQAKLDNAHRMMAVHAAAGR